MGIGRKGSAGSGSKYVEIKAAIKTEYYISGLAPNGDDLVVLAYIPEVAAPAAQVEAAGAITTSAAALLTTKQVKRTMASALLKVFPSREISLYLRGRQDAHSVNHSM